MGLADYLHEHRDEFILQPRARMPMVGREAVDDDRVALFEELAPQSRSSGQRRRRQRAPVRGRYRHVTPALPTSPFADLLPYIEPWERI